MAKINIRVVNKNTLKTEFQEIDTKDKNHVIQLGMGVNDSNGKEIFEGDIVDIETAPERWNRFHEQITFENGMFNISSLLKMGHRVRVIGNINGKRFNNFGEEIQKDDEEQNV